MSEEEYRTRLGRVEAENAWRRGDGDSAKRAVRRNLESGDATCHVDTWVTLGFVAVVVVCVVLSKLC